MKAQSKRLISLCLVFVMTFGLLTFSTPSASAAFIYNPQPSGWNAFSSALNNGIKAVTGVDVMHFIDRMVLTYTGQVTLPQLKKAMSDYNSWYSTVYRGAASAGGLLDNFEVGGCTITDVPSDGISRLVDKSTNEFIVDSRGRFPYVVAEGDVPAEKPDISNAGSNRWLDVQEELTGKYEILTYDNLSWALQSLNDQGYNCSIRQFDKSFYAIYTNSGGAVYGKKDGTVYVAKAKQSAVDIDFDYIVNNNNVDNSLTVDNSQLIDIENGIFTKIDDNGTKLKLNIDSVYYDASKKSYTLNTYNIVNNTYNYYTYNLTYNYQYTYVTYIGSSAEYQNEEYKLYYQLPDGRSSADLTAEDLAGMSLDFDVVNYDQAATDTHTQSLYHFDGNWQDSSYFSNQTKLSWGGGASVTYMNSNAFDGCLYLDEKSHDMIFTVPNSNIFLNDYTVQFRYYIASAATKSKFTLQTDGTGLYKNSDSVFACLVTGGTRLLVWDTEYFYVPVVLSRESANGHVYSTDNTYFRRLAPVPIGSWVDICVERANGTFYLFLNGMRFALAPHTSLGYSAGSQMYLYASPHPAVSSPTLYFGTNSSAGIGVSFSQLDEFRIVDFAVYTASFEPSPVPFDTNNVFVLPETEGLNPLTVAVMHDTPVSGFRAGGVRPTFPAAGLVWFPIEDSRITDCQIYNGSYWESVECRLWTGSRWIPLWAFDVFTLSDCYDIADQDVEVSITTESGFWNWFKREWTDFRKWLKDVLGSGGGGSGPGGGAGSDDTRNFWDKIADAITGGLATLIEGLFAVIATVLTTLLGLVMDTLSFIFDFLTDTVLGGISDFFSSFGDGSLFEGFQPGEEGEGATLPEGVAAVFAFFSGAIMLLPGELRGILFFGIAALLLFGIFKLIKS